VRGRRWRTGTQATVVAGLVTVAVAVTAGCTGSSHPGSAASARSSGGTGGSTPNSRPSVSGTASTPFPPPFSNASGTAPSATAPSATVSPVTDVAAQRLFARSKAATAAVRTMRITGTETSYGVTVRLDLRFGQHNTAGRITQGGYTFDLIFVGRQFYFRAPVAFLRAQYKNKLPAAVKKGEGKYVVSAVTSANARPYASLANRNALVSGVYYPHPNLRRGPNRKVNGVVCASLVDPGRGTFYVRADNALPVEIDASAAGGGHLTFSQLNRVPEPTAPAPGQAVDGNGNPV
jgi:hypothetical protein